MFIATPLLAGRFAQERRRRFPLLTVIREQADGLFVQTHNPAVFNRAVIGSEAYAVTLSEQLRLPGL